MKADIAIIGGGASGLAAAVSAARNGGKNICILEKQPRVGKKLLATGNGRCNLYNENACADAFFGSRSFAVPALREFSPARAEKFFLSLGIMTRKTEDGLYYPMSNQASSVLDCLRETAKEAGVNEITGFAVSAIEGKKGAFRILSEDGNEVLAKRVIVACGSMASPKNGGTNAFQTLLKSIGHRIRPCFPVLTNLKTLPECVSGLKGLKYQGDISLYEEENYIAGESGEILFGENSISGIAAMQLSVYAAERLSKGKKLFLKMCLLPMSFDETAD
ncbi:MAG: aminoacetone oxidase family FAD-binding enzyme, partial [Clostridia bacterium]|nr:aminoacetone oxidase family FAD-binding enzyme [Clostridia bacterium]